MCALCVSNARAAWYVADILLFFCEALLQFMIFSIFYIIEQADTVTCPTCRTRHDLPSKGAEGFTTNFTANNQIELLNLNDSSTPAVVKCENEIDDNPAATKCLDCNLYLCEECTTTHKTQRLSKNHKLATLAELKKTGLKQLGQKRLCSDHDEEELKLYCRTCQEVICRDCAIVTHKQHDYTFIKDVREELTKKIKRLVSSTDGKEAEYKGHLECVHQASENETQRLVDEETKVKQYFDNHIQDLQLQIDDLKRHKAAVLSDLATASSVRTKQLLADEESLQFSQTRLTNARSFTQQQLSSASNTDLAMMSKQVIQQLETIRKHKVRIVHAPLWEVSLSADNPLNSKIQSLSADAIANGIMCSPDPPNSSLLGKNSFQIYLSNVSNVFKLEPAVTVTLSSGDSCPVIVSSSGNNTWSVQYFITRYPQPGQSTSPPSAAVPTVKVSVEINGVQANPYQLNLKYEISVGTKVSFNEQQGIVVDYAQNHYNGRHWGYYNVKQQPPAGCAFVQFSEPTSTSRQLDINQLTILPDY